MSDPTPPDDLDALLAPPPADGRGAGLRDLVMARTERALRRGRRLRQSARVAAGAAVFAAGGLVGWGVKPGGGAVETGALPPEVVWVPVVVPVAVPVAAESAAPGAELSAREAELLAEQADAPGEAARLYRRAGDAYLTDRQDYRNAVRCYRLFLSRSGVAGLSQDPADTWLLTSLKNAAFQEKSHVAKTDG